MNRKSLSEKICNLVIDEENKITLVDMETYGVTNNDNYKSGLYFLYNKLNECIYVGKVGNGDTATLYMRMVGNGNASHRNDPWHDEINFGYWHKFDLNEDDIETIERLAILGMKQPIYNDKNTNQQTIDLIVKKLNLKE